MILFYFLVLSLPFVDHGLFGREILGMTLEKIVGAACFLYALAYLPRRRVLPELFVSAQAKVFTLYVVLAITSYVLTAEDVLFRECFSIFLSQFLFFITAMILVDSRERLQNTILFLIGSIGLTSLYLIREWIGNVPVYGLGYRPGWVAGDPNLFSASALVVLPLMLAPATHAVRKWQRVGIVGCLGVTLFALLIAASRGGFIGLVCMLLWRLRDARRRFMAFAISTLLLLLCLALPYSPLERLLKPSASDVDSTNIRLQLWAASGKMFADHPVFGVGLWNFHKYLHRYLPRGADFEAVVPHNTYVEVAVELGGVGLLIFAGVLALSLWDLERMRRAAVAAQDSYFSVLSSSLSDGLVGFGVAAMFLSALHAKVFWFAVFLSACIGPLLAQSLRAAKEKEEEGETQETATVAAAEAPAAEVPAAAEPAPIRVGNWLTRH